MVTLFDQEKITKIHEYNIAEEARAEGEAKGRTEGMVNGIVSSIRNLMETLGLSIEQAMTALKVPEIEKQKYLDLLENQ